MMGRRFRAGARAGSKRLTVLCTIATGTHQELFATARPSFERFAAFHGFDLVVVDRDLCASRPPSWSKVVLIRELLETYDRVVWVDSDAVIVHPIGDIFDGIGRRTHLRLVVHRYLDLEVPNLGVMAILSSRWSKRFFARLWSAEQYVEHKWWENAAALELLGYDVDLPQRSTRRRTMDARRVDELDLSWNSVPIDPSPSPRIRHFPGMAQADRLLEMRHAASKAAELPVPADQMRHSRIDEEIGKFGLALLEDVSARRHRRT